MTNAARLQTNSVNRNALMRFITMMKRGYQQYGPEFRIQQEEVDNFTERTGDPEPLHKAGGTPMSPVPIAPGLFEVAFLPRLLPQQLSRLIPGLVVLNKHISCEFTRLLYVGQSMQMRFRAAKLAIDELGFYFEFEFQIRAVETRKVIAYGIIQLRPFAE